MLEEEVSTHFNAIRIELNLEFIRWQYFDLNEVGFSSFNALKFSFWSNSASFSLLYSEATKEENIMTFVDEDSSEDEWLGMKGYQIEKSI